MAELERLHVGREDAPALIFVHGLGGHPKDSWRYEKCQSDDFWLHWVGRDTGCDVWTLEYDAALSAWTEQAMPLPDQGSHIMDRLSTVRELQNKRLILVGHSMGGLVIKTMLTYGLYEDNRFKGLANRIQGIVFIATPHGGAQLASLFEAIKIVSRANPQVGDLSKHDHHLEGLNRRFLNSVGELGIKVRIFAEMRGVTSKRRWFRWFRGPSVLVVDRGSANPGVPDCPPINLPEDHFSICKPKDRDAQIHGSVCDFVTKIAEAPVEPPHVPPTDNAELQKYPGQLSGPGDNLLQPRDGRFYGRDEEVKQVLAFLRGTESARMVSTLVGGVGGAGKTEVCKAALKSWLAERSGARAFYVGVPDGAGLGVFIAQIGLAIGKPDCATPQELLTIMPSGLWYLDNLEGIADDVAARDLLRAMRNKDGVRLLASSRTMLNNIFGTPIKINQLPADSALRLFRELWGGEGAQLPDDKQLADFVIGKLGAHALSITLMARLGNSRSFAALVRDWEVLGTDIVDDGLDADDRQGSLNVSLRLTANALASIPGALHLWTLVALFDDGVSESDLEKLEQRGGWTRAARQRLADHHVLFQRNGRWHVLPPLARYALRAAQKDQDGFSWPLARKPAQDLFIEMAEQASAIKSNAANLHARDFIISHFSTVANLITHEINSQTRDNNWILQINRRLTNLYQFRIALSYPLLCKLVDAGLGEANMFQSLGDLERLLGQVDAARRRYDAALVLCRQEQDRLGEANTLRCLGDLEFRLGQVDAARQRYDAALVLYRQEQYGLGEANTLRSLGDLESRLGQVDAARQCYDAALVLYRQEQIGLGEANTLKSLGDLEFLLEQVDAARQCYDAALVLYRQERSGLGEASTLRGLGDLESLLGQVDAARQCYDAALVLYRQEQDGLGEANTLQSLGDLERLLGKVDAARAYYRQAVALYRTEQEPAGLAYALADLARCLSGPQEKAERDAALAEAEVFARASNAPRVVEYVLAAIQELRAG